MTDKQIIIDGVPVQDCLFLATNKMGDDIGTYCRDFNGSCKNIQNCYFKRWQRKEQECERLKEEIKIHNDDMFKNTPEKRFYCRGCTLPYISKKLSKTLTEIKEIAEICKCHNADGCYECKYFDDCEVEDEEIPTRDVCKLILQKISEVKDGT